MSQRTLNRFDVLRSESETRRAESEIEEIPFQQSSFWATQLVRAVFLHIISVNFFP